LSGGQGPSSSQFWGVARRPRWIGSLVLALLVAAGFAALGQWQLERSIASGTVVERTTETSRPLTDVAEPQAPTMASADGQLVTVSGAFVADDWMLVSDRLHDGDLGVWLVGHLLAEDEGGGADLAVAVGWVETEEGAASALESLASELGTTTVTLTGRYVAGEPPQTDDFDDGTTTAVSPPALINDWSQTTGRAFGGYLISDLDLDGDISDGVVTIDAPAPEEEVAVNWLNVFYAVEWVVFAGFAIFMWYRLVRDAWERETELADQGATVH
jgi:surfeit locus 1 family protein